MSWLGDASWVLVAIWAYLLAFHGRFWTTGNRLDAATPPHAWPSIAVVVPARDEEEVLATTLPRLLAQDYPGPADVVVVDDRSNDATAEVATSASRQTGGLPLTVITGEERPPGWAGKLWALHQGIGHASEGTVPPEWLLLTDADIDHPPYSLARLVAAGEDKGLDMVSLMARLRVSTGWERLIVPAFVYFFAQLYPFRWVAARRSRVAAAAGGCILVRRRALEAAGGILAVRGAVIDDVALAGALKRSGALIWLGLADEVRSVRPYPRLADLWDMVARSAFSQLRYSPWLLVGTLAGLALAYLAPVAALAAGAAAGSWELAVAGALAWATMVVTYLPMIRYYHLGSGWAFSLPAAAALYAGMTLSSAARHWSGGVTWKGRSYQAGRA